MSHCPIDNRIELSYNDKKGGRKQLNRSIIREIAKKNGVTTTEVRREIKLAIDAAYENPAGAALLCQG